MEWFCTAIQLLGMTEKTGDYKEDALNLVAKMPVVLAAIFRIREGWGEPIAPRSDLDYVENPATRSWRPSGGTCARDRQSIPPLLNNRKITDTGARCARSAMG